MTSLVNCSIFVMAPDRRPNSHKACGSAKKDQLFSGQNETLAPAHEAERPAAEAPALLRHTTDKNTTNHSGQRITLELQTKSTQPNCKRVLY
ncbi:hypothetical protein MHYP_G00305530 [Metynnis hypsauchen]